MRRTISNEDLRLLLKGIGWSQRKFSGAIGVGTDTVNKWATGKLPVPLYASEYLRLVKIIKNAAAEV